ncbi:MAG: trigger factor family protein [Bacillus subtilis]|nr:trigger factor family protein [Bacillus subtilis]
MHHAHRQARRIEGPFRNHRHQRTPEHALDHAFEELNQKVEIKGFRKGKAPRNIYEAKYGVESLYEEAVNHAIQDTYYDAIVEHDLKVVAQPKINFDFKKVKRGEDFIYEVVVAVKPDVKLGQYKASKSRASPMRRPTSRSTPRSKPNSRNTPK